MAKRAQAGSNRPDWAAMAIAAARSGRLDDARGYFAIALEADGKSSTLHFNYGVLLERRREIPEAAAAFSTAARLKPGFLEPALRLSMLLARYQLPDTTVLDPAGLRLAMAHGAVDGQPLAEAAFARLKQAGPLGAALAIADAAGPVVAARELCLVRTGALLTDELFQAALSRGVNMDPEIEPLLAAVRNVVVCELPADRFSDRTLTEFCLALALNCRNCEYVWDAVEHEAQALAGLVIDVERLAGGDFEQGRRLLLHMLHRPVAQVLPDGTSAADLQALRPRALRDLVAGELAQAAQERGLAAGIDRIGTLSEQTSRRVAAHYEQAPYPRWLSLNLPRPGVMRAILAPHVAPDRLTMMDRPFDVLIAGCGTGRQAIQAAAAYGSNARMVAIDLSAASLGYGKRMARSYGRDTIRFVQADILDLEGLEQSFDVIECIGVLHHLADPFAGWRALCAKLRSGGLMQIALYSAVSRRPLAELRAEPEFPGLDCSDAAARRYRRLLLTRPPAAPGASIALSKNAYTLSEFRDLVLHVSEQQLDLLSIDRFLQEAGLIFRGFVAEGDLLQRFAKLFPGDAWPGSLPNWAHFEQEQPRSFDGMYRFWCEAANR